MSEHCGGKRVECKTTCECGRWRNHGDWNRFQSEVASSLTLTSDSSWAEEGREGVHRVGKAFPSSLKAGTAARAFLPKQSISATSIMREIIFDEEPREAWNENKQRKSFESFYDLMLSERRMEMNDSAGKVKMLFVCFVSQSERVSEEGTKWESEKGAKSDFQRQ